MAAHPLVNNFQLYPPGSTRPQADDPQPVGGVPARTSHNVPVKPASTHHLGVNQPDYPGCLALYNRTHNYAVSIVALSHPSKRCPLVHRDSFFPKEQMLQPAGATRGKPLSSFASGGRAGNCETDDRAVLAEGSLCGSFSPGHGVGHQKGVPGPCASGSRRLHREGSPRIPRGRRSRTKEKS